MKKLLIVSTTQFGYSTDAYKWCQYLWDRYDITYICFDSKLERVELDGVDVRYISNRGFKLIRGARYLLYVLKFLFSYEGKVIVNYFEKCEILKWFFPSKRMILDIRSLAVSEDDEINKKINRQIERTAVVYDAVSIISEGVKNRINIDDKKCSILPLGADVISQSNKTSNGLRLLYVGTLNNRRLDLVFRGLSMYINKTKDSDVRFTVIGSGCSLVDIDLRKLVNEELNLSEIVDFKGRIVHIKLEPYFAEANVGVAFVPIKPYYDYQPVTKSYEYIKSGLFTIATNTSANQQIVVNEVNGILIDDTAEAFCESLIFVKKHLCNIDKKNIRGTLLGCGWKEIVDKYLVPIIESV